MALGRSPPDCRPAGCLRVGNPCVPYVGSASRGSEDCTNGPGRLITGASPSRSGTSAGWHSANCFPAAGLRAVVVPDVRHIAHVKFVARLGPRGLALLLAAPSCWSTRWLPMSPIRRRSGIDSSSPSRRALPDMTRTAAPDDLQDDLGGGDHTWQEIVLRRCLLVDRKPFLLDDQQLLHAAAGGPPARALSRVQVAKAPSKVRAACVRRRRSGATAWDGAR